MLDLDSITELTSAEVKILHPITRQPTGAVLTLAGPEHPERKRLLHERQRTLRARFARSGRLEQLDPEQEADDEIAHLVACTLGWKGIQENGLPLAFNQPTARALYSRPDMAWLRRQAVAALSDVENFIQTSAAS